MRSLKTRALPGLATLLLLTLALVACKGFFVDPVLTSINITPLTPSVVAGQTQQLNATGVYDDNTTKPLTSKVTWTSSSNAVATVSSTGLVTAVSSTGSPAAITATLNNISGTTTVSVTAATLTAITIQEGDQTLSLAATPTFNFSAKGTFSDSTTSIITTSVTWQSDNLPVATIQTAGDASPGQATLVATGTAHIRVISGAVVSPSVTITVNP
jgi:uncharacterized membrane protein YbhN (UPF0104 family)